jgi:hypothetical protein
MNCFLWLFFVFFFVVWIVDFLVVWFVVCGNRKHSNHIFPSQFQERTSWKRAWFVFFCFCFLVWRVVFFAFFSAVWIVGFLSFVCGMNCCFLCFFCGMNCVFFVCFFVVMICVFCAFCGMNCVFFGDFLWYDLCLFLWYDFFVVWIVFFCVFYVFFCLFLCFLCVFVCVWERRKNIKKTEEISVSSEKMKLRPPDLDSLRTSGPANVSHHFLFPTSFPKESLRSEPMPGAGKWKNVIIIWCVLRTSTTIVGGTPL